MTKFCQLLKWSAGILWQYSGWDSKLSLPRAQIQSLVRELRFPKVCSVTKKKKKKRSVNVFWISTLQRKVWDLSHFSILRNGVFPAISANKGCHGDQ